MLLSPGALLMAHLLSLFSSWENAFEHFHGLTNAGSNFLFGFTEHFCN